MRFGVDPAGEFSGRFDGPRIGSGPLIAYRPALVIGGSLREDATEFRLAGVGPPVCSFSASSLGFFGYHRPACAVHLHIDLLNRIAHGDGQCQLHGLLYGLLLMASDIGSDRFRHPFHGPWP